MLTPLQFYMEPIIPLYKVAGGRGGLIIALCGRGARRGCGREGGM